MADSRVVVPISQSLGRALGLAALAVVGGAAAWGALTWRSRHRRWERRAFVVDYQAAAQGIAPLEPLRAAWRKRLEHARARHGSEDLRTLVLRCRMMAFDELAADQRAAAEQIDALLPHVAKLEEEERWLFVVGLHWLEWQRRRGRASGRCRVAFEAFVKAEGLPLAERVHLGVRLARAAAHAGRLGEAREILERARGRVFGEAPTPTGSPYRGTPPAANDGGTDESLRFEVCCERVRLEINACAVTEARAALAELDAHIDALPTRTPLIKGRSAYWHAMVQHTAGNYAKAEALFAEAERAFDGAGDDELAASHRAVNRLAWLDTLLDLERPETAASQAREHLAAARSAGEARALSGMLATALLVLGDADEAEQILETVGDGGDAAHHVGVTRARLALRRGDLAASQRLAAETFAHSDRRSPYASDSLLAVGRVLAASGRPRLGERTVRIAAALVIDRLGPEHPQLTRLYRFLAERRRAAGQPGAARSLDEAADRLLATACRGA